VSRDLRSDLSNDSGLISKSSRPHLCQGPACQLAKLLQVQQSFFWIAFPDAGDHVGDEIGGEQGLSDGIMQLARQPVPLRSNGCLFCLFV
jgi:hypothetical protein